MIDGPILRPLIASWCHRYPPEGNFIPQHYKDHTMILIGVIRALSLIGFFFTGGILWTWLIWWPIIFAFNSDDFFKVYEEYWEVRLKKKLSLTQVLVKTVHIVTDDQIAKNKKRTGKK